MHRFFMGTAIVWTLLLSASLACATPRAPAILRLGPPQGMKQTKTLVSFPHSKHEEAQIKCATCHHTWDGKSAVQSCAAPGCHDQPGKKGKLSFYQAFHSKKSDKSCLGCHKRVKKEDKKPVPVACKSCHPK